MNRVEALARNPNRLWLVASIVMLMALLLTNAGITYRRIGELHDEAHLVAESHKVLGSLEDLVSTMKDAETGHRGYLITGREEFLEPYNVAVSTRGPGSFMPLCRMNCRYAVFAVSMAVPLISPSPCTECASPV